MPFFVPPRRYADQEFPGLEDLIAVDARALAGERPTGWVSSIFRDGRGMLLVDGLDELAALADLPGVEVRGASNGG